MAKEEPWIQLTLFKPEKKEKKNKNSETNTYVLDETEKGYIATLLLFLDFIPFQEKRIAWFSKNGLHL